MIKDNLLDQGSFGCVYYPPLKCNGKFSNNKIYISKLQRDGIESMNEYNISQILKKKVKNYNNYYSIILSKCNIDLNEIKEDLSTCKIYEKLKKVNKTDFTIIDQYFLKNKKLIKYFLELGSIKDYDFLIHNIQNYRHLCRGLFYLSKNNIVHYDLHGSNILFDLKRQIPIIIDFGLSIDFSKIKNINNSNIDELRKYFYVHAPSQISWCYEIHIVNFLINKQEKFTNESLTELLTEVLESNITIKELFTNDFYDKYKECLINYYKKYVNKSRLIVVKNILKSKNHWDIFSISLIFLRILNLSFTNNHLNMRIYKEYSQILAQNIHPNPYKRLGPNKTIDLLKKIHLS